MDSLIRVPNPILRKIARPIPNLSNRTVRRLKEMLETMRAENGIGLAAPQVGWPVTAFVMNAREEGSKDWIFVNPRIAPYGKMAISKEGCLSIPGVYGEVLRHSSVVVIAQDLTGKKFAQEFHGLEAFVVQHEFDHCSGVLFTDKLIVDL